MAFLLSFLLCLFSGFFFCNAQSVLASEERAAIAFDTASLPRNATKIAKVILKSYKWSKLSPEVVYPGPFTSKVFTSLNEIYDSLSDETTRLLDHLKPIMGNDPLNLLNYAAILGFDSFVTQSLQKYPSWMTYSNEVSQRNILHYICMANRFDLFGNIFGSGSDIIRNGGSVNELEQTLTVAWMARDRLKKTPFEYCLEYGHDLTLVRFMSHNIFQIVFEDGSTPIDKLISRGSISLVQSLMSKYPEILYGASQFHGNIFHIVLKQPRPFSWDLTRFVQMLWQ